MTWISERALPWLGANRRPLIIAGRMIVSAALAFLLAKALHLALPIWAVISAIIVSRASRDGIVKMGRDRLLATAFGAVSGAIVALVRPYGVPDWALIALGVAAPAILASLRPELTTAPVAAAIVLSGDSTGASSTMTAVHRLTEVALGAVVAIAVAFAVRFAIRRVWPGFTLAGAPGTTAPPRTPKRPDKAQ